MQLLIEAGADISIKTKDELTLVHHACRSGNAERLGFMTRSEGFRNFFEARTRGGVTPLMFAVQSGNKEVVDCCLNADFNPFATDNLGQDVLTYAAHLKEKESPNVYEKVLEAQKRWRTKFS